MLPSSPMPHSRHITQSESTTCGICTNPVDESLQVNDSLIGPSLPHSDPSPTSLELTTELATPAPIAATPMASHPMITLAKAGIFKNRHPTNLALLGSSGLLYALLASTKPKGFKAVAKNLAWLAIMDEEVQALQTNRTWILVPRPGNTNIVGSKWVFQTKYLPDGSIERLKARLVAKGYTQVLGLDYTNTFNPVIKATTVHVVLSFVVTNKWSLCQLDVKNAFLNGHLTEYVYMEQPPGHANTSLFVFHRQSNIIYLLLYVDDIITGNNSSLLDSFTRKLNTEFATKDLGSLSYFLGLEATSTVDDPTLYRSLVVALQYLTITRLDIAHVVNSAGCPDTRRSTSCYSIYLGDKLVSWSAKKQPTVSHSSYESEYHALTLTAVELFWLTHLLRDLRISLPQQPLLLCDNKSAIFFSSNPISHKRAKHVELLISSPKVYLGLFFKFFSPSSTSIPIRRSACGEGVEDPLP
ncbi:Retrovirus-related Pol polyprotein from transposon RE1 [Vitis vinifera]|uniref:Retrovirus-related Pol polyprotein from transposon RE1 n=1 Tax=Vitis vinifera TaxID=29760 RepID=A0A438I6W9_VITVI|nr:Retrovirus-related Pol polyprotein from transposon RE1 [Vitis vinifera]